MKHRTALQLRPWVTALLCRILAVTFGIFKIIFLPNRYWLQHSRFVYSLCIAFSKYYKFVLFNAMPFGESIWSAVILILNPDSNTSTVPVQRTHLTPRSLSPMPFNCCRTDVGSFRVVVYKLWSSIVFVQTCIGGTTPSHTSGRPASTLHGERGAHAP